MEKTDNEERRGNHTTKEKPRKINYFFQSKVLNLKIILYFCRIRTKNIIKSVDFIAKSRFKKRCCLSHSASCIETKKLRPFFN